MLADTTRMSLGSLRGATLGVSVVAVLTTACTTNPYTGRSQLNLMSSGGLNVQAARAYHQMLQKSDVETDPNVNEVVGRVTQRLIDAARRSRYATKAQVYEWEVNVARDGEVANAFCLAGGKIMIFTGILPYAKTEDGLAAIVAHEIAHALAEHSVEDASQSIVAEIGFTVLGEALGRTGASATQRGQIQRGVSLLADYGLLKPYSRTQESEADYIGLLLTADAGYDPREAIGVWDRMRAGMGEGLEFMSTHPNPTTRIDQIQGWLPEATAIYEKSQKVDERRALPGV